jgi:hypothetical protein
MNDEQTQQAPRTFLGMPMNWEWDPQRILRNMWNPEDERVFPPKVFGIGWDVNGHALMRRFGLMRDDEQKEEDR